MFTISAAPRLRQNTYNKINFKISIFFIAQIMPKKGIKVAVKLVKSMVF